MIIYIPFDYKLTSILSNLIFTNYYFKFLKDISFVSNISILFLYLCIISIFKINILKYMHLNEILMMSRFRFLYNECFNIILLIINLKLNSHKAI